MVGMIESRWAAIRRNLDFDRRTWRTYSTRSPWWRVRWLARFYLRLLVFGERS